MVAEEGQQDVVESICVDAVVIFNGIVFFFPSVKTRGEILHRWTELCVG